MEVTGRLLFVGAVTCYLLARIMNGGAAPVEIAVYGMTASFGLEYILASWSALWEYRSGGSQYRGGPSQ
jgi:hypothetical protein